MRKSFQDNNSKEDGEQTRGQESSYLTPDSTKMGSSDTPLTQTQASLKLALTMKWYFVACIFLLVSKSVQSKSSQQILDEVKEIAKKSCTAENAEENKFYFPHPEKEKFIQCDEWGNYHVMQCAPES
ncbi:Hypothetical predicted protein [Octopus vulgaris]|uniref:Uncharacterized protein n=1 Tax=Octopus vulgaris TaxID=6645 RepID=A0AA36AH06_OCTVU|nr:Hypothetical predicted protein [Octopus vulgaris]